MWRLEFCIPRPYVLIMMWCGALCKSCIWCMNDEAKCVEFWCVVSNWPWTDLVDSQGHVFKVIGCSMLQLFSLALQPNNPLNWASHLGLINCMLINVCHYLQLLTPKYCHGVDYWGSFAFRYMPLRLLQDEIYITMSKWTLELYGELITIKTSEEHNYM